MRRFEQPQTALAHCWLVVRVDGQGFSRFTKKHGYEKPNDTRGLGLMNRAAACVMKQFPDIVLAYGQSDEYSFVFHRKTKVHGRRHEKLTSLVVSCFTAGFHYYWTSFFGDQPMEYPATFDARLVCYPTDRTLVDYCSWRQVDCHVNNMYNTCFWNLVNAGSTPQEAELQLKGTVSSDKNELLFSTFGINYAKERAWFRKGTILIRLHSDTGTTLSTLHVDLIKPAFWNQHMEQYLERKLL